MTWRVHVVREGEHLELLARQLGFDADTVWLDAHNDALRALRPNPSLLAPGDLLHVIEAEPPSARCVARRSNRYRARVPTVGVSIVIQDRGAPLADEPYVVEGLPERIEGRTDAHGRIAFRAPLHVREVTVELVDRRRVHPVRIGHLDPIETDRGVRQRLEHLGYVGPRALERFQRDRDLEASGHIDAPTRDALRGAHGA
jgi:hypothetical protein